MIMTDLMLSQIWINLSYIRPYRDVTTVTVSNPFSTGNKGLLTWGHTPLIR